MHVAIIINLRVLSVKTCVCNKSDPFEHCNTVEALSGQLYLWPPKNPIWTLAHVFTCTNSRKRPALLPEGLGLQELWLYSRLSLFNLICVCMCKKIQNSFSNFDLWAVDNETLPWAGLKKNAGGNKLLLV